ncbi:MAG: Clp protease N-terminal domain-containing protein [Dongiaceae bacterium]
MTVSFERLTDNVRLVFALGNQEAQRFNHEYIQPEHILLGLIRLGRGVACQVLQANVELRLLRINIEKLMQRGQDIVTMGKLPHSQPVKDLLNKMLEEAKALGHNHVGTEHLLLALLKADPQKNIASKVLSEKGLTYEKIKTQVAELEPPQGFTYRPKSMAQAQLAMAINARAVATIEELLDSDIGISSEDVALCKARLPREEALHLRMQIMAGMPDAAQAEARLIELARPTEPAKRAAFRHLVALQRVR